MKFIYILVILIFLFGCAQQKLDTDNIIEEKQNKTPEEIVAEQEYQPTEKIVNKPQENFTLEKI